MIDLSIRILSSVKLGIRPRCSTGKCAAAPLRCNNKHVLPTTAFHPIIPDWIIAPQKMPGVKEMLCSG
jgi:hypothetical protein